jgi:hypothetical protein
MCWALLIEFLPQEKVCLLRTGVQGRGVCYGFSAIDGTEWICHKLSSRFVSIP